MGLAADALVVMGFARHLESFIVTQNLTLICQIRDFGSGHPDSYRDLHPGQHYRSPG
jgi:hypothetical protein